MDSPQTRAARVVSDQAHEAWSEHVRHCPWCAMPTFQRGPCLRGVMLRDAATMAGRTVAEERELDAAPMPGEQPLFELTAPSGKVAP